MGPALFGPVPEYLGRNVGGKSPGELVFHVFLAMLHDEGAVDEPNVHVQTTRRALAATIKLVQSEQAKAGLPEGGLGNIFASNGRSMIIAHGETPLRLRRLWVLDDKGARDDAFRGVLFVSGGDGEAKDGFEDVPNGAVLITRDLQVSFADLNP